MKKWIFFFAISVAVASAYRTGWFQRRIDAATIRDFVNPGPLSVAHQSLENKCEACHTPNAGVKAESCIVCHANDQRLLQRQPTVFHATIGECASCHFEHTGRQTPAIQMDHVVLARIGLAQRREGPIPRGTRWTLGSTAEWIKQWRNLPAAETVLNCGVCHSTKDRHVGLFGQDCSSCHTTAAWKVPGYRHPPENSLDCAQCHQAPPSHYMEHFEMVSMRVAQVEHAKVNECFVCHRTTVWNDIRGIGYYKHH